VLTVDIARLLQIVDAGVTQPVQSDVLEANIPAEYCATPATSGSA
jgi:iron(III) transport system substrate-binding protein